MIELTEKSTEADWIACPYPFKMLDFVQRYRKASDRKLRLLVCSCHLLFPDIVADSRRKRAIEIGEQYADGLVDRGGLEAALREAAQSVPVDLITGPAAYSYYELLWPDQPPITAALRSMRDLIRAVDLDYARREQVASYLTSLLHELFGPVLFRRVMVDPAWLTWRCGIVRELAAASYQERSFDRLPVLADALEEAGCTDADLLGHLRGSGPHVRGCWALDLLLGKE
jgi:hypothetical protein